MKIINYAKEYKIQCLEIFKSNLDKYFARTELFEFDHFLDAGAELWPYFVVLNHDQVLACGGYSVRNDIVYLSWGMVERSKHNSGVGTFLLQHRLEHAKNQYGNIPVQLETSQYTKGFYQKSGFAVSSTIKNGFGDNIDKVSMVYQP